jgi:hypothetical protein
VVVMAATVVPKGNQWPLTVTRVTEIPSAAWLNS